MIYRHEGQYKKTHLTQIHSDTIKWPPVRKDLNEVFVDYLYSRELDPNIAKYNGWYPTLYDNHIRIVIPASGNTTEFWQARAIEDDVDPKYDSPPVPRGDTVILVLPTRIKSNYTDTCVIAEGPMDALAAAGEAIMGIALMGNSPNINVIHLTSRLIFGIIHRVILIEDRDSIGSFANLVSHFGDTKDVLITSCPSPYKDLAAMPKKERSDFLERLLR